MSSTGPESNNLTPKPSSGVLNAPSPPRGPGLSLPEKGLASLFEKAFQNSAAIPGVLRLVRDEPLIAALAQTASFATGDLNTDLAIVRRNLQNLHQLPSAEVVRASGNALIGGFAELFARTSPELPPELKLEGNVASKLTEHLTIVIQAIQDAASQFHDPTLWRIVDDKFIAFINPNLAVELANLSSNGAPPEPSVLMVFDLVRDCAAKLADPEMAAEMKNLFQLVAGLSLQRLSYAIERAPAVDVKEVCDFGLKERLAVRLATLLGTELVEYSVRGNTPFTTMLRCARGDGYSFVRTIFAGFFRLGDNLHRVPSMNRDERALQDEVLKSYETLGACAGSLWPTEFAALLREGMGALSPYNRAAALKVLRFAVSDSPENKEFLINEALKLLGHGASQVNGCATSVLRDFAEPLAEFVSAESNPSSERGKLISRERANLLDRVLIPLARDGRLAPSISEKLGPYVLRLLESEGVQLFESRPLLTYLISPQAGAKIPAASRSKLADAVLGGFCELSGQGTIANNGLPNRDPLIERKFAAILSSLGANAISQAFRRSNEFEARGKDQVGPLAIRVLASQAALEISSGGVSAVEKTGFGVIVLQSVLPTLQEVVRHKQSLLLDAIRPGSRPGKPESSPEVSSNLPSGSDDVASLVTVRRHRAASLAELFSIDLLYNPSFVCDLTALEGEVLRNSIRSPLMPERVRADVLQHLTANDLQMVIAQHEIEQLRQNLPKQDSDVDSRIAGLVMIYAKNALKSGRAQQEEFNRIRRFLVEEIRGGRITYDRFPCLNRVLLSVVAGPLKQNFLGLATESDSGADMALGLALDVFAAFAAMRQPMDDVAWRAQSEKDKESKERSLRNPSPQRLLRGVITGWFRSYPQSDARHNLLVSPAQMAHLMEAMIPCEGDPRWAGQAIYVLAERAKIALDLYRESSEGFRLHVAPVADALTNLLPLVAPEFEAKDPQTGETAHVHSTVEGLLAAVRKLKKSDKPAGWHGTQMEKIPTVPFRYRANQRIHVGLPEADKVFLPSSD